jgi:hypothetical protein
LINNKRLKQRKRKKKRNEEEGTEEDLEIGIFHAHN